MIRARALILGLIGMFAGWLGVLVVVGLATDAAPASVVMFPSARFITALPPDAAIVARSGMSISIKSDTPQLAARLYHAGALIVLPAGLPGCLPLPASLAAK